MVQFRDALRWAGTLSLQSHFYFAQSITIIFVVFLIYSISLFSLMMFLLNINSTPSPLISKWVIISPFLGFLFKEDTGSCKCKPTSVLATRMLLFINNRGKSTDIGNPCWDRLSIIPISPQTGVNSWKAEGFIMPEACCECVHNAKAKLSPAYLIPILVTFGPIVVSLPLLSSRSLFGIKKPVECLPKPCLFIT